MCVYIHLCGVYLTLQSGWSALMAAVWRSHEEVALRMIEAGATPDIQDKARVMLYMTDVMFCLHKHCDGIHLNANQNKGTKYTSSR